MKDSKVEPSSEESPYDLRGNGVVYTPLSVAQAVVEQALTKLDTSKKLRVLEPSCGEGSFVRALKELPLLDVFALDKDDRAIDQCRLMFSGVSLCQGDFFTDLPNSWPDEFDLIIGNPPYIGWHRCDLATRTRLGDLCREYSYMSGFLKNAWAGFVVKAAMKLSENGVLAFVIPYEFLTVSYGKHLREWMSGQFSSIDIYVPDEKAFKSIDQDAVTVIATKGNKPCETLVHRVASLEAVGSQSSCLVPSGSSKDSSLAMKGFLLSADAMDLISKLDRSCTRLSDFCDTAAGTVTAANEYFILSRSDVSLYNLEEWARPIIKKSGFLGNSVDFSSKEFEAIERSGKACFLLDFSKIDVDQIPKAVERYIAMGEELGVHLRYKCRHRPVWYKVPVVIENDGLFFKRSHVVPRLCMNSGGVLVTDSAYHIRMKEGSFVHNLCGSFYNSLTLLFAEIEGRFYGGGVLELTPSEFRRLPLSMSKFSVDDFSDFQQKFSLSDDGWAAVNCSNERLRASLSLSEEEISTLEAARQILQKHRLRHGSSTVAKD